MLGKQLVETLTDAAVMDASHISSVIELDGYYGVYETMTEDLNEYIDGFYKSSKDSLLHRYIRTQLVDGLLHETVIENTPEEYVLREHNEALFSLFGYTFADVGDLPPEYDEEYFDEWKEFAEKVNDFYCDNINEYWTEHVFYVLFANKDFLFRFNTEVIEELLLGMKDVHEAGIIHRDLHLGNILIKEGHVVLSDFGLSKDTMINHSLKSTSTPKNSHYFIDPIGLHDFTALDKLSDIYSIGKIIDYIIGESQLNKKLSFVISKATERNRAKRYTTMDEMIQDVNSSVREISEEEKLQNIEVNLQHGEISKDVEEFVMRLMRQEQLSNYIVRKQLYTFWKVLIQFNEIDQLALLGEIDRTYSEATGYGHFENYDLFAGIAYNVIRNSANMKIQRKAYRILEGCASYRYNASDYLKEINIYYPNILSQE